MDHDFETLREELERSLGGLDDLQTQLRPTGDLTRWSIQQIVGHLLLTYASTEQAMEARIEKGTPTKAEPSVIQRLAQFTLIRMGHFPSGRKAPEQVIAVPDALAVPGGVLIADIDAAIVSLDRRLAVAETIFGPKVRAVSHMVLGPLSIWQWRRFHLIHGRHHIAQVRRIRAEYGM